MKYIDGQIGIFAEEQHGGSHNVLVVEVTWLDFMEWHNDCLKENDVLFSERNGKPADDARKGNKIKQKNFKNGTLQECLKAQEHHWIWHSHESKSEKNHW